MLGFFCENERVHQWGVASEVVVSWCAGGAWVGGRHGGGQAGGGEYVGRRSTDSGTSWREGEGGQREGQLTPSAP